MTLIYRGQKYVQNKEVAKKQHNELTYRGKAYTSQFINQGNKKATKSGFFIVQSQTEKIGDVKAKVEKINKINNLFCINLFIMYTFLS